MSQDVSGNHEVFLQERINFLEESNRIMLPFLIYWQAAVIFRPIWD